MTHASEYTADSTAYSPRGEMIDQQALDFEVPELGREHIRLIEKCNGFDEGMAKPHFDSVASNYDAIYQRLGYPDPKKVAEMADKHAKARGIDKSSCRILDLGCGTGLVGKQLADRGFKNIVGLDISTGMMEQADIKSVYTELIEHDILNLQQFPREMHNAFDLVVCAGLVTNNHMDKQLFDTMMTAAKKKALCIFASRRSFIGNYWYNDVIDELVESKRLK